MRVIYLREVLVAQTFIIPEGVNMTTKDIIGLVIEAIPNVWIVLPVGLGAGLCEPMMPSQTKGKVKEIIFQHLADRRPGEMAFSRFGGSIETVPAIKISMGGDKMSFATSFTVYDNNCPFGLGVAPILKVVYGLGLEEVKEATVS